MGTRAVTHLDLRPLGYGKDIWIATHWDGDPKFLGADLQKAYSTALKRSSDYAKANKSLFKKDKYADLGGYLQKEIEKATAEYHIDQLEVDDANKFNKEYGDWAEYFYEVTPKGVKFTAISGEWTKRPDKKLQNLASIRKKAERIM